MRKYKNLLDEKMKKISLLVLIVGVLIFLQGCVRWHNKPLQEGIYQSTEEIIEIGDLHFESIKIIMEEISNDEFLQANGIDVVEDLATPSHERKYYSIKLFMKQLEMEYIQYELSGATSGAVDGIRNEYFFHFDYVINEVEYSTRIYIELGFSTGKGLHVQFDNVASLSSKEIFLSWRILSEGDEQ
jgi:hypothetical protein